MPSPARKALYSVITVVLTLGVLEVLARGLELRLAGQDDPTALPIPGDLDCLPQCVPGLSAYPQEPEAPGIRMVYDEGREWWVAVADDDSMEFNRLGMRGPDLPTLRPPGEQRILALGDSTVWGHGVAWEDVFTVRAASLMTERTGASVRAVVGAQPGMDVGQAQQVLAIHGADIGPSWVLIGNLWSDLFHAEAPEDLAVRPASRSALYRVLHLSLAPWLKPRVVSWLNFDEGVGTPAPGRRPRTTLDVYMRTLYDMAQQSQEIGAKPVYIILPAPIDLDGSPIPPFVREYREAMLTIAARVDAPVVDGPACLVGRRATNAAFYDQVHPSPVGHQLLAECVADTLMRVGSPGGRP